MNAGDSLGVWLDGVRIADLTQRGGAIGCRYTDEALDRWPQNSPVISCSLPLGSRRLDASAFCKGLLPEGNALQTLAQQAGLAANDSYAADPADQLDRLVAIATYTTLIGNADAHGKNLAFLHPTPEHIVLAPLYDTVPTVLWPRLRTDAAMSIGAQISLPDVTMDDIIREARLWRHPEDRAHRAAIATIETVTQAVDDKRIPPDSEVAAFVRKRAVQLLG